MADNEDKRTANEVVAGEATVAKVEYPEEGSVIEGSDGKEVVVYDRDDDDKVVGWHKAPKGAK